MWGRAHALMAPNVFHVPGVPAVVHTQPTAPLGAGAEFHTMSPAAHTPVVGAADSEVAMDRTTALAALDM